MRHAGNFNPEWGYLAPAPTFMRTARVFIVAALVGGTAGAAVVLSLMDRPAAEASVAARTLVSAVEPPAPVRALESAPSGGAPAPALPQPAPAAVSPAQHRDAPVATAPQQGATTLAHAVAGDAGGAMNRRAPAAAAVAEAPRIMAAEVPAGSAATAEKPGEAGGAQPAAADMKGIKGLTAFSWKKSLTYTAADHRAVMLEDVHVVHQDTDTADPAPGIPRNGGSERVPSPDKGT